MSLDGCNREVVALPAKTKGDTALIAHLLRRAGFGEPYERIEALAGRDYESVVEELLHPERQAPFEEDLAYRLSQGFREHANPYATHGYWLYRMINTKRPLEEKITLFWHGIHCVADSKVDNPWRVWLTLEMFRQYGLGSFRDLLVQLGRAPDMIFFLDNNMSHRGAINENWGRELLELFSMGVGNYTEDDIKQAARAFTGWTNAPAFPIFPYSFVPFQFSYDYTDHDEDEKSFLGQRGPFNGEDVIDIICKQPATARFVARHLYNFFVADEPSVPEWPHKAPRDAEAIDTLVKAYFDSNYDIRSMLRVLFNSGFFKNARFAKVKSPAEVVAGAIRITKDYPLPRPDFAEVYTNCLAMGQFLINPPTVEGWHTGQEWIDSGTLVERVNFVVSQLRDPNKQGTREIVERLKAKGETMTPESFVDHCVDQMGVLKLNGESKKVLVEHAKRGGAIRTHSGDFTSRALGMLQLIGSTKEYQFA